MAQQVSPTKGNLIKIKKTLQLAQLGYELLDRKRNILIRETMQKIEEAKHLEEDMRIAYSKAHEAIKYANMQLGIVDVVAAACPIDNSLQISYHSIMGVDVPKLVKSEENICNSYGYYDSTVSLDNAVLCFSKAKELTLRYAELENSIFSLADGIKKTKKRANALKNILIPRMSKQVGFITAALEEKEREEFTRSKVIKNNIDSDIL